MNYKADFVQEVYAAISKFEGATGVEVNIIKIRRVEFTPQDSVYVKSIIAKIEFELG